MLNILIDNSDFAFKKFKMLQMVGMLLTLIFKVHQCQIVK